MSQRKAAAAGGRSFFNPFPKYLQVRQVLERRLAADYELGQQIPTEQALCAEFGVSRETVREALRGLEADGIVERHRPRGTFLVRRPDQPVTRKLTGLVEDLSALKLDTQARVLASGLVKPTPEARAAAGEGEQVFCIRRLRVLERQPLVLHEAFLPPLLGKRVARFDLKHTAISQVLQERLGLRAVEESQQIEAMVADPALAELLGVAIGAPVLLIRRVLRLPQERATVLFKSYFRADRYFYTLNLAGPAPPRPAAAAARARAPRK